jgi:hypothetical protein
MINYYHKYKIKQIKNVNKKYQIINLTKYNKKNNKKHNKNCNKIVKSQNKSNKIVI